MLVKYLSPTKRFHNISFENLSVIKEGLATRIRGEIMERGKLSGYLSKYS